MIAIGIIVGSIALLTLIYLRMSALAHYELENMLLANRQVFMYDYDYDFRPESGRIPGWNKPKRPEPFLHIVKACFFPGQIVYLQIHGLDDTNAASLIKELESWQSVQHVNFFNCSIDENTANALKVLKNLKVVGLRESSVSRDILDQMKAEYPVVLEPLSVSAPNSNESPAVFP